MKQEVFLNMLVDTLYQRLISNSLAILVAILLIYIANKSSYTFQTKKKHRVHGKETTCIALAIILLAFTVCSIPSDIVSVWHDIESKQFVEIQGIYQFDATSISKQRWIPNDRVYVFVDGECITLSLPVGWTSEEFPEGIFQGTILYSQESKIILNFSPNSD